MTSFANASVLSRVCCRETVPTGMFAPSWPKPSVSRPAAAVEEQQRRAVAAAEQVDLPARHREPRLGDRRRPGHVSVTSTVPIPPSSNTRCCPASTCGGGAIVEPVMRNWPAASRSLNAPR
jgi:hypothetical protein